MNSSYIKLIYLIIYLLYIYIYKYTNEYLALYSKYSGGNKLFG